MTRGDVGIDARSLRWLTSAMIASATIESFETTATQSIAPTVLAEIGGQSSYALVFGAFFLAELVALVLGAWLIEGRGPVFAYVSASLLHAVGLLLCAVAGDFSVFVLGRVAQGLAAGVVIIAIYVFVGSCFADEHRSRVLGLLVTALAVPGLLGPVVAGAITEHLSWRLVLWPVIIVELVLLVLLRPTLGRVSAFLGRPEGFRLQSLVLVLPALTVSVGVIALLQLGEVPAGWRWQVFAVAVLVVVLSAVPLLPAGSWRLAPGLPTAVLLRGLVSAPWIGLAFLVPLSLVEGRGFSLTTAGVALSCGVVGYAGAGVLFGTSYLRDVGRVLLIRAGVVVLGLGLVVTALGLAPTASAVLIYVGWPMAGFGVCVAINSLSVVVLSHAESGKHSRPASAMAIAENIGAAVLAGVAGLGLSGGGASGEGVVLPTQVLMIGSGVAVTVLGIATATVAVRPGATSP